MWVHYVSQPGSWHTTVGHGNSTSAKRYEFDLELLQKDLTLYGHDSHTHYYLGSTYAALAKASLNLLPQNQTAISTSIEHAIHYPKLRAVAM